MVRSVTPIYTAKIDRGFSITHAGRPLTIALLTPEGEVVTKGGEVAAKLFNLAVETHEKFWLGNGHLKNVKGE